jgi:hypothetical protein
VKSMNQLSIIENDALDAYIYGYPIVLMAATQKNMLADGLLPNQFLTENSFPGPKATIVVRPNVDTLYVTAWLDLSKEPVVIHAPDTNGKYDVMALLDDWTNVFAAIGSRTTGTMGCDFVIAGPGWKGMIPQNLSRIDAPTNTVWIIGRVQTNGPKDYPIVNEIQKGFKLAPLGYWEKYNTLGISNQIAGKPILKKTPTKDQVEKMDAPVFFKIMVASMDANPPAIQDIEMNRKLAALGLSGGSAFDFFRLPLSVQQALATAVKNGPKVIRSEGLNFYKINQINGWSIPLQDIGVYGTHYIQRAVAAMFLFGANVPEDAVYGFSYFDDRGKPLKGNGHYHIHIGKGQLPPVKAFWSITLYDSNGFLTENPIKRYAISPHLEKLGYNRDGSLDIYIQNDPPEKSKITNWLPSPKGLFNLALRMYWPEQAVLDGEWRFVPLLHGWSLSYSPNHDTHS